MKLKLSIYYGGGGTTPAQEATNSTTVSQPWAPAQPYVLEGFNQAANLYGQGPDQYTPWSQTANFDPLQIAAQNGITNYINSNGTQNMMNNTSNVVQNALSGKSNALQNLSNYGINNSVGLITNNNLADPSNALNYMAYGETINPYAETAVNQKMKELSNNFAMNTLPGMRRNAIGNGTYGSSRNEMAEGLAAGQLSNDMNQAAQGIWGSAYNTAQQNSLSALGQSAQQQLATAQMVNDLFNAGAGQNLNRQSIGFGNYTPALITPLSLLEQQGQVGLAQQAQNQQMLNDATNRWNFNQNAGWNALGQYKNLLNPQQDIANSGSAQASQTTTPSSPNTASTITGGLLSAAGLAAQYYGGK